MIAHDVVSDVLTDTATEPDWELAKALYHQRVPILEIVKRAHVPHAGLKKRITRQSWGQMREQAVSYHITKVQQLSKDTSLRTKLRSKLDKQIDALPDTVTSSNVGKFSGVTLDLARAGSLIEGWSDSTTSKLDIHVLSSGADILKEPDKQVIGTEDIKHSLLPQDTTGKDDPSPLLDPPG